MNTATLPLYRIIDLPPRASAVPDVRRRVVASLREWGCPEADDLPYAIGLVASELITNAITHAGRCTPRVQVTLDLQDGTLRIGVRDNHPVVPRRQPASPYATCGRGTVIAEALLGELDGRLRIEMHDDGKTVWAEVPSRFPG
ncbi:ATP-binding protein [Streptomyces chartreusis]|uniref:ATP-binding protein n=1 Tax=Streptomyces chartreusis TaxID=1969 RepID=UPI0037127566